jgi:hypothetical protein
MQNRLKRSTKTAQHSHSDDAGFRGQTRMRRAVTITPEEMKVDASAIGREEDPRTDGALASVLVGNIVGDAERNLSRANVARISCGEAPRAGGRAAHRLPQLTGKSAGAICKRCVAVRLGATQPLQRRARRTARRQLLAGVGRRHTLYGQSNGLRQCITPPQPHEHLRTSHCDRAKHRAKARSNQLEANCSTNGMAGDAQSGASHAAC